MAVQQKVNGKATAEKKERKSAMSPRQANAMIDRAVPQDTQAEIALLGSIMLMPKLFQEIAGIVTVNDFYDDSNGGIFAHMKSISDSGKPVDERLLVSSLKSGGDWEAIGGAEYMRKVINAVPNAAHAVYYAEIVAKHSVRRKIIHESTCLLRDAYDESFEPLELVGRGEAVFQKISDRNLGKEEPIQIGDSADYVVKRIMNPESYSALNRCHWGVADMDDYLGPILPGEMAVIAARPGQGKTAFAMQLLREAAKSGGVPLIVSLEMPHTQLSMREMTRLAGVDSRDIRGGKLDELDKQKLIEARYQIGNMPLFIWSPAGATFAEIRATIRRVVKRHRVTVVALDYLSLIEVTREEMKVDRSVQVGNHCKGLKRLAKELEMPFVVLQQLSRDADDCEPSLRHLRESGAIEQDADIVVFLHHGKSGGHKRGKQQKQDIPYWKRQIIVAKFRDGQTGEMVVGFSGKKYSFVSIEQAATDAADENAGTETGAQAAADAEAEQRQKQCF